MHQQEFKQLSIFIKSTLCIDNIKIVNKMTHQFLKNRSYPMNTDEFPDNVSCASVLTESTLNNKESRGRTHFLHITAYIYLIRRFSVCFDLSYSNYNTDNTCFRYCKDVIFFNTQYLQFLHLHLPEHLMHLHFFLRLILNHSLKMEVGRCISSD